MRHQVEASGGWLFPGTRRIELIGQRFPALELKMRHVFRLERDIEAGLRHPYIGHEEHVGPCIAPIPWCQWKFDHFCELDDATKTWPPRLGTENFLKGLGLPSVQTTLLRCVLRRAKPRLSLDDARYMVGAMNFDEWSTVFSIAWGRTTASPKGDGAGMRWKEVIDSLMTEKGQSWSSIENLFITQFFAMLTPKDRYELNVSDYPTPIDDEEAQRYERLKMDAFEEAQRIVAEPKPARTQTGEPTS